MSILIKDMEIPKNCVECKLSDHISPTECPIYSIEKGDYWDKRYKYCPLVEVPTPHGRLIDADFEERHYTSMTVNPTPDVTKQDKRNSLIIIEALQMAKTIIEEEGNEE